MIKNYFKIAWRNIINNKVYSAINILGLAAGMGVALLIALWVFNQFSYDRFLPNYKQVYQVEVNLTSQHNGTHTQQAVAIPLADVLRKDIAGIEHVAETDWVGYHFHDLMTGDKKIYTSGGEVAPDFLKIFRYTFIKGNPAEVLNEPYSIVINESMAKALFGNEDPINKIIRIDNQHDVKVTGVMKDIPANASIRFNFLLPFRYKEITEDWMKTARTSWTNNSFEIFIELKAGVTNEQIAPVIKNLIAEHSPEMREAKPEVFLHPLADWHLYSNFKNGKQAGGFIEYVRMFSIIGILVLLIACINFTNLSTARSERRAREVGVRKAVGSQRRDLIVQFLSESVLVTFIAFLLSLLLVRFVLPWFSELTGSSISIPFNNPVFWGITITCVFVTGVVAGSKPAFYLSSFNPVKVLKGSIRSGKASSWSRKILVVMQFTCSVALIISTIIVYQQIQHAKNRPTGYSADRLIMTDMGTDLNKNYDALKNDLMQTGVIENVARASSPVTQIYSHMAIEGWPGKNAGEESINVGAISVSEDYFKTLGMQLTEGSDFTSSWNADTSKVILNEAAVKRIGLKDPINQLITWNGSATPVRIIGIAKDALMESPFTPVEPLVFTHGLWGNAVMYRLLASTEPHEAIEKISKIFGKYSPAYPFSYRFVDDEYNNKFRLETLVGKLAAIFAGLAIFISCLGLFGLAAFMAERRTKEIGVRKVVGASVFRLWFMLSMDFVVLVVIGCLLASPLAFYFLQNWLQKYDYRITISPGVFIMAAMMAVLITLFTISFQSIKAAFANPVKSLRTE